MFGLFKKNKSNGTSFVAPISGRTIPLSQVEDPVFSKKMVGDGVAIVPTGNVVVAPCDGTIALMVDSKHAFAMTLENGIELLIHVGLDTVALEGKGFKTLANVGDKVTAGTPVLEIDREFLLSQNINLTTPVLIANVDICKSISPFENIDVEAGKTMALEYTI